MINNIPFPCTGGGGDRTAYSDYTVQWESNVTSGVMHTRLLSYVRKQLQRAPGHHTTGRYYHMKSPWHVTFPTVITVSIVRSSIFFVLINCC